jgi:hypothetical protein
MVLPKWVTLLRERLQFQPPQHRDHDQECPLCRHGTLSTLMMMDAMSCDFCRHIFSIDITQPMVQEPIIRIEDSSQSLAWQWTGSRWKVLPQADKPLIIWLWVLCGSIVTIPSLLMILATHLFPATPHSRGAGFAFVWLWLTIGSHVIAALWILSEHYQWPIYQRFQRLLRHRVSGI